MPVMAEPPPLTAPDRSARLPAEPALQHVVPGGDAVVTPAANGNGNSNGSGSGSGSGSEDNQAGSPVSGASVASAASATAYTLEDHTAYFLFRLQRELDAINGFFENELALLLKRLEEMGRRLPAIREAAALNLRHKDLQVLMDASRVVIDDLRDLDAYAHANVRRGRAERKATRRSARGFY